jgi:hypothetical protein
MASSLARYQGPSPVAATAGVVGSPVYDWERERDADTAAPGEQREIDGPSLV